MDCCGTCRFHRTNDEGEWVCFCKDSENYGLETDYQDTCEEREER